MRFVALLIVGLVALLPGEARCQQPALLAVWGESGQGPGALIHPTGLALDPSGKLYVADLVNHRIQVFDSGGGFVRLWGSYGSDAASITMPMGLAVDTYGHVFVAEEAISSPPAQTGFQVFTVDGTYVTSWGTGGNGGCSSTPGDFCGPFGVAVGKDGHVYVTDVGLQNVQVFANAGAYLTRWAVSGGPLALDAEDNVYVATGGGIWKFSSSGAVLGSWGGAGTGPGQFSSPMGIAVDASGNVYVSDTFNNRVQVFTNTGAFVTQWGTYGSDPGQFYRPAGIAIGPDGRIFVADTFNDRIEVFGALPTRTRTSSWGHLKAAYR